MTETEQLAEHILICAAKDSEGNCYPCNIQGKKGDIYRALSLLELYGKTNTSVNGPIPIFTINELGKNFAANGAWSEKSRLEALEEKRHNEHISSLKRNTYTTLCIGIFSIIATIIAAIISRWS